MYFETFADFIQMGRHGAYVWSAYGISAALIVVNLWLALRSQRQAREQVQRQARRDAQAQQ